VEEDLALNQLHGELPVADIEGADEAKIAGAMYSPRDRS
jgi:hypothetical protein